MTLAEQRRSRRKRRTIVARLCRRGWKQSAIAVHLKVDPATITRDCRVIEAAGYAAIVRAWQRSWEADIARLDWVERELWLAWEESRAPVVDVRIVPNPKTGGETIYRTERDTAPGDPRCMTLLLKCSELRLALQQRAMSDRYRRQSGNEQLRLTRLERAIEAIRQRRESMQERQRVVERELAAALPAETSEEELQTAVGALEPGYAYELSGSWQDKADWTSTRRGDDSPTKAPATVEEASQPVHLSTSHQSPAALLKATGEADFGESTIICDSKIAAARTKISTQPEVRPTVAVRMRSCDFARRLMQGHSTSSLLGFRAGLWIRTAVSHRMASPGCRGPPPARMIRAPPKERCRVAISTRSASEENAPGWTRSSVRG